MSEEEEGKLKVQEAIPKVRCSVVRPMSIYEDSWFCFDKKKLTLYRYRTNVNVRGPATPSE